MGLVRSYLSALVVISAVTAFASGCGSDGSTPPYQHFLSRPDLKPPPVHVLVPAHDTAPGFVFIAPKKHVAQAGPLILDNRGHVVWFHPLDTRGVTDFRVQRYRGKPVLTWWRGRPTNGKGDGNYAIVDTSYRTVARVRPGNGLAGDIHEFLITKRNTALMTIFHRVRVRGAVVFEGALQEVDIASGRVLFEWHSLDHVALDESYEQRPKKTSIPYDYFHVNSIDVDTDGNLLVSARNTHTVYKIDRRTGRIIWRLGGKRSDFTLGPGARFAWQHDARRLPDGTISLFDNEAAPQVGPQSRVIVLRLDMQRRRATLVRSYTHKPPLIAVDQGNAQYLPDGHFLVGWGHQPYVTEFDARGRTHFDLRFGQGSDSYRAFRFRWVGQPLDRPAVVVKGSTVYVSWNGATEVAAWRFVGSRTRIPKTGFETAIALPAHTGRAEIEAVDARGHVLGTSPSVSAH
jgi:Arylsulfotransferase (ASST)